MTFATAFLPVLGPDAENVRVLLAQIIYVHQLTNTQYQQNLDSESIELG